MSDKSVILIDGGYYGAMNRIVRSETGDNIDLEKLSQEVCEEFDSEHIRTKFYHAYPYQSENPDKDERERYSNRQSFYDAIDNLRNHQFVEVGRVRKEHNRCKNCGENFQTREQKGADVGIAIDLVDMAHKRISDAFIILAGDEDFTMAADLAKDQLCNIYVAFSVHGNMRVSDKLTTEADDVLNMDMDFLKQCRM